MWKVLEKIWKLGCFRYTVSLTSPTDNCYLSNRSYKELDFYTDLEPDRDFDVYTMNNMKKCDQPAIRGRDDSGIVYDFILFQ